MAKLVRDLSIDFDTVVLSSDLSAVATKAEIASIENAISFEQLTLSVLQIIQDNHQEVIDRLDGLDDDAFTGDIIDGGGALDDGYTIE